MPRRTDLKRVLIIGSGPIVIGQACEFDYSGSQACKALRAEGLEVVLVNSNPATIMTDPELADRTYVEPLTPEVLAAIIERERPDALLPTVGGQTGAQPGRRSRRPPARPREVQRRADRRVDPGDQGRRGSPAVQGRDARDRPRRAAERPRALAAEAVELAKTLGFPLVIRPSFTLGGVGGGIAYNIEEFRELAERGLELSPVHEVLIEESVIGWKEFELEVMRDVADNFVVICSIENIDPMGVHTGDSITVAPILTLTDKEYQRMRDAARRIIRRVGVETGGSNIQFAVNPGERPDDRHRDEPARVALVGAGVEGHRLSRSRRSPPSSRSAITSTRSRTTSRASRPPPSSRPSTTSSSRSRAGTSRSSRRPIAP